MGNNSSQVENDEEIIIMADIKNIVKHFVKENFILWHDPKINSNENSNFLGELKTISDVKTFSNWQEAAEYLKDTKMPCCQVITSGTDGEFLVKEISQLQNIYSIHIFCGSVDYHKKWAQRYDNDFDQLKANLEKKLIFWQREESSLRIDLPSYAPIFDDVHKSENKYLHFYLKGFVHFKNRNQAKKDLLDLAKALYGKNTYIEDFQNNYNYNMKDIINWYTKQCFLYIITNNCLRIATPDSIQCCRLVLRDLEQAIKEKYQQESKNFSGLLYRAACISDQEWTNLSLNIGKEIEMYGFLSTSKNKMVALQFLNNEKAMITIIVPALKYYSKCINCKEKKEQNGCIQHWHVIILETHPFSFWSEEMSEKELNYLNYYQTELEYQESATFQQALIFYKTHNHKGVIEYIHKFLERHGRKNDPITASSYDYLGNAYFVMGEYQKAIQFYDKALRIKKTLLGVNIHL